MIRNLLRRLSATKCRRLPMIRFQQPSLKTKRKRSIRMTLNIRVVQLVATKAQINSVRI
jgi:hypothetical protein